MGDAGLVALLAHASETLRHFADVQKSPNNVRLGFFQFWELALQEVRILMHPRYNRDIVFEFQRLDGHQFGSTTRCSGRQHFAMFEAQRQPHRRGRWGMKIRGSKHCC